MSYSRKLPPRWTPEAGRHRPRDFDPGLGDEICERVANGETLATVCLDDHLPLPATFLRWCREDDTLAKSYAQAQEDQCDVMLDEMTLFAEDIDARRAKNAIDARRTIIEKKLPKKYGPRSYMNVAPQGDETPGGADAADVRRRIEQMAQRAKEASEGGAS